MKAKNYAVAVWVYVKVQSPSTHVGSGGVPGGELDLFIHLQLVVVHVLLCKDEAGAFLLFMPHYFQDLRILIS